MVVFYNRQSENMNGEYQDGYDEWYRVGFDDGYRD